MQEHKIRGRRGQAAEAMTWAVATIIVFIVTFLFLLATSALAKEKDVKLSAGSFKIFGAPDSGIATQQMLYALLQSKHNEIEIQKLIEQGSYNDARGGSAEILERLKSEGILCNFFVRDRKRGGYLINLDMDADGTPVSVITGKDEVILQCQE